MTRLEKKIRKLFIDGDVEWKEQTWQRFVREHIGCDCCQHFDKEKTLCKIGHQDILTERRGMPCEEILPTALRK